MSREAIKYERVYVTAGLNGEEVFHDTIDEALEAIRLALRPTTGRRSAGVAIRDLESLKAAHR